MSDELWIRQALDDSREKTKRQVDGTRSRPAQVVVRCESEVDRFVAERTASVTLRQDVSRRPLLIEDIVKSSV